MSEPVPFWRMAEFWIAVVDAVVAITLRVVGQYAPSETLELVQFIIDQVQPIIILIIVAMLGQRVANVLRSFVASIVKALDK